MQRFAKPYFIGSSPIPASLQFALTTSIRLYAPPAISSWLQSIVLVRGWRSLGIEKMTNYVVNHQKKKNLLAKRERELLHALRNGLPDAKILKSVENVRAAKLSVFKMDFSRTSLLPASSYEPEGEAVEWMAMTVEEILAMYR